MAEKPRQTVIDYVTIAISPALIMALVGSLVFFLIEVAYAGAYGGEMRWMLFFFVFGMVLIARIALMGEIAARAGLYALVLGGLVWFGLMKYVSYPANSPVGAMRGIVNLAVIVLAWWCVNRLVRDCTQIDDNTRVDSRGLLQAAGLEELDMRAEDRHKQVLKASLPRQQEEESEPVGWFARWQRYREERKQRRTPGVTVVYFSLAALPLFGLGQSLIPAAASDRRRYVFWLLTIYVGSGLGLLLTTSFLGLRRYLNQRKLKMPPAMTGMWLAVGGGLIAVLLLLGAFLPRPLAEYPLFDFEGAGADKQSASKHAVKGNKPGEGEGRANAGKDSKNPDKSSNDKDKGSGKAEDRGARDKDGSKGGKDDGKGKKDDAKAKGDDGKDKGDDGKSGESGNDNAGSSESPLSAVSDFFRSLASKLKWIVFGIVAVIVIVLVLRSGLKWLANFFDWARNLLDALRNLFSGLFGGWGGGTAVAATEAEKETVEPARPFASFSNPFSDGSARGRSPRELVRYTFAAFEAWARERHLPREEGETPLEFVGRVGDEVPAIEEEGLALANLFAQAAYSTDELPKSTAPTLRATWERMSEPARQAV